MGLNGRLTPAELTDVGNGIQLAKPTARAWLAMVAAARKAGVELWVAAPHGGYRSYAVQQAGIDAKNPDSIVPIAAAGESTHGWGSRVDIGSWGSNWPGGVARAAWVLDNAHRFGFDREFGAADPNHFRFRASTVPAGGEYTLIGEDDMPFTDWPKEDQDALALRVSEMVRVHVCSRQLGEGEDMVPAWRRLWGANRITDATLASVRRIEDMLTRLIGAPPPAPLLELDHAAAERIADALVAKGVGDGPTADEIARAVVLEHAERLRE